MKAETTIKRFSQIFGHYLLAAVKAVPVKIEMINCRVVKVENYRCYIQKVCRNQTTYFLQKTINVL